MIKSIPDYKLINFASIILCLIPIGIITGPFIPDLFLVIINFIFVYLMIKNKEYNYIKNKYFIIFIIFCLIIISVSLSSEKVVPSLKNSSTYIRFGLFSIATLYILQKKPEVFNYLKYIFLVIFIALFIDTIFQLIFSVNIFGQSYENKMNFRLTSFFGDDEVLGSYVARLFPLTLFFVIYKKNQIRFLKEKYVIIALIIISFTIVLLSGERTSLALIFLNIFILFLTSKKLRKIIFISGFICLIVSSIAIFSDERIKNRMITTTINQLGLSSDSQRIVIFSETYEGHYKISLKMFKEKPIFGHGIKMFRYYCAKPENYLSNNACTTHPHNFYAQMLSELGIFGFFTLLSIFLYISFLLFQNTIQSFFSNKEKLTTSSICLLSCYFINFFPFLPSGNLFNNWLSILIYYPLGFLLYLIKNKKFYV